MRLNKPYFQINSRFFPLGFRELGHNCDLYRVLNSYTKLSQITFYKVIKIVEDIFDLFSFIVSSESKQGNQKLSRLIEDKFNLLELKKGVGEKIKYYDLFNEDEKTVVNPGQFDKYADGSDNYLIDYIYCCLGQMVDNDSVFHLVDILGVLGLNGEYREIRNKDSGPTGDSK